MPSKAAPASAIHQSKDWSLWLDVRGTGFKVTDSQNFLSGSPAADVTGRQVNVTAGIAYKLTPDLLAGLIVGAEFFKYDVTSLFGSLKGDGETVGGYVVRRFGDIRVDGSVVWSNMHYDVSSGAAVGSLSASRWLGSGGVTGDYKVGAFLLEPSTKIFVLTESEAQWTDSLGTAQPSRSFTSGRVSAGAKFGTPWDYQGLALKPFVGLFADYVFMSDNAIPVDSPVAALHTGWAARATTGLALTAANGTMLSFSGELGGLGSNYKVWTGNLRATVPF